MKLESLYEMATNPYLYLGSHRHILLLSHMRCYSSLLGHIFGSNPSIAGFAELHMPYDRKLDLLRMRKKIHTLTSETGQQKRIFFDKLLHNQCHISPRVARLPNVDFIIAIRKPKDTIASIVNMGNAYHDIAWYRDTSKVVEYYVERLSAISDFIIHYRKISDKRPVFFRAERLLSHPEELLSDLSLALGFPTPLCSEYSTFSATGRPGIGDPSNNIKAGKILRSKEELQHPEIDPSLSGLAEDTYNSVVSLAQNHCLVL